MVGTGIDCAASEFASGRDGRLSEGAYNRWRAAKRIHETQPVPKSATIARRLGGGSWPKAVTLVTRSAGGFEDGQ